jgi:hypothetical protein
LLPGTGTRRVTKRVVPGGRFGQAGQQGRFGQGQFSGGFAKKSSRRLADTIGTDTEGNLVDVSLQYFLLGKLGFNLESDQQFTELAHVGPLKTEKQVLGQLLGDGGRPLDFPRFKQGHPQGF